MSYLVILLALDRDDPVFHGVLDQLGTGFNVKLFHHPVLVEFNGPSGDIQNGGDFFPRLPIFQIVIAAK